MPILSWGEWNDLTHAKFNMQDEKTKKPGKYNHSHEHRQEGICKNCGAAIGADTMFKHLRFIQMNGGCNNKPLCLVSGALYFPIEVRTYNCRFTVSPANHPVSFLPAFYAKRCKTTFNSCFTWHSPRLMVTWEWFNTTYNRVKHVLFTIN